MNRQYIEEGQLALRGLTGDKTIEFDDYDRQGLPVFISKEEDHMEYTIDEEGNIWSHEICGLHNEKIGTFWK